MKSKHRGAQWPPFSLATEVAAGKKTVEKNAAKAGFSQLFPALSPKVLTPGGVISHDALATSVLGPPVVSLAINAAASWQPVTSILRKG
jgi:hypothetical protein